MDTQILDSVAKEPPLLRWLHSHDPDRNLTRELLASSGSIHSHIPSTQAAAFSPGPSPSTSSLFVPMYRRKHFVLGQLYGPMSPNVLGLVMLAAAGYGTPPVPVSRRFVADLSLSTLDFLEYEWLSDGKLCVTIHHIRADGLYHGQTILLDKAESSPPSAQAAPSSEKKPFAPSDDKIETPLTSRDLIANPFRPVPTKVVMRSEIIEHLGCQHCHNKMQICQCEMPVKPLQSTRHFQPPTNWHTWIRAMAHTRKNSNIQLSMRFSIVTPSGVFSNTKDVIVHQDFEVGVEENSPQSNLLLRMFMQSSDMMVSHPTTDSTCRSEEERRQRIHVASRTCTEDESTLSSKQKMTETCTSYERREKTDYEYTQSLESNLKAEDHNTALLTKVKSVSNPLNNGDRGVVPLNLTCSHLGENYSNKRKGSKSSRSNIDTSQTYRSHEVKEDIIDMGHSMKCSSVNDLALNCDSNPRHSQQLTISNSTRFSASLAHSSPAVLVTASSYVPHRQMSTSLGTSVNSRVSNEVPTLTEEQLQKKKSTNRKKVFTCECGRVFKHRGHYNEHRLCVHEKVRQHKCAFIHCQSRFFKKSDRDRHMRSKHDVTIVSCVRCNQQFSDKQIFLNHEKQCELSFLQSQ